MVCIGGPEVWLYCCTAGRKIPVLPSKFRLPTLALTSSFISAFLPSFLPSFHPSFLLPPIDLLKPAVDLRKICHPGKSFAIVSCQGFFLRCLLLHCITFLTVRDYARFLGSIYSSLQTACVPAGREPSFGHPRKLCPRRGVMVVIATKGSR